MPRHDPSRPPSRDSGGRSLNPRFAYLAIVEAMKRRKRRPGRKKDDGGVPVEPNRPLDLSGGAEAPLEFDEG